MYVNKNGLFSLLLLKNLLPSVFYPLLFQLLILVLLVHMCAAGLCVQLRCLCMYIRTYMYTYVNNNRLFSVLSFINLLLSVFTHYFLISLSLNTSSMVCYVQQAVQTEQFTLFLRRSGGLPSPEIYSSELSGTCCMLQ